MINDYEIAEWEKTKKPLLLFVCSTCGLIANDTIEHEGCALQDWWHLNVKCFVKEKNARYSFTKNGSGN